MSDPFDYGAARDKADVLLAKFGIVSAIRKLTNSGTSWEPTQTPTDTPTIACVVNLPRWYPAFADNSDILRTDRLGLVSMGPLATAGVTEILPFDLLIFGGTYSDGVQSGGKTYRIIDAKPIAPADIVVLYKLQLRI